MNINCDDLDMLCLFERSRFERSRSRFANIVKVFKLSDKKCIIFLIQPPQSDLF